LLGGRRATVEGAGPLLADGQGGSRSSSVGNSPADQQRTGAGTKAAVYVRAVYQCGVPAVLSSKLEGFHCGHFRADSQDASDPGVREKIASCDPAGGITGSSRPEGAGAFGESCKAFAVVSKRNFQAG